MLLLFSFLFLCDLNGWFVGSTACDMLSGACDAHFSRIGEKIPGMMNGVVHALGMVDFEGVNLGFAGSLLGGED